jgi:hypothetical protein
MGEVTGPHQRQSCSHDSIVGDPVLDGSLQLVDSSKSFVCGSISDFGREAGQSSVADPAERIDGEPSEKTFLLRDGEMKQKMSAPRVPDDPRLLPPEMVKDPPDVAYFLVDVDWTARRGRRKAPLLIDGDFEPPANVFDQALEVFEGETRTPMEH